ncbi:CHASE domain-containing protein [Massilia sp. DWR3-1-1]|uniref:CHASE domain-containing protein n=1 Tax=Massilia sp. DWR3-1-1 TaxID=2804559 RepID=UPI003CF77F03
MRDPVSYLPHRFASSGAIAGGLLLSLLVGAAFYTITAGIIERDASRRFTNMARSVKLTVDGRIKSYTDVLRGSASLFATSKGLTREQFHRYVEGLALEREFPGVETINFARYVDGAERARFERQMNEDVTEFASGYPAFAITPPGNRPYYTVLTYIEPISAWAQRFGWDISARGNAAALEVARDTGQLSASGVPIAPLSGVFKVGLAMRLPIYRSDMPDTSVASRRAYYLGSVGIGFSVNKLVVGVLDQLPARAVRMIITDVTNDRGSRDSDGKSRLLFDSAARPGVAVRPPAAGKDDFTERLEMNFGKRRWLADFSVQRSYLYSNFDTLLPWAAMLLGAVSCGLLTTLFQIISSSRRHAVDLAQTMTQELRASEAKLQWSNENLRRLAAHVNNIREDERKRIAREIHDDLGQNLLALRIEADMLSQRTSARQPRLHERALATLRQIDATIKSVRQIINDLRPNVLDLGVNAAVDWQISEFRRRTGIDCQLIENDEEIAVSDECATALFRILQESLSNISRHAKATRVKVELSVAHGAISMTVSDNGVGVRHSGRHKAGSFGLVGIEERMNILNGEFSLVSSPGGGTTIHIAMPVDADPARAPWPAGTAARQASATLA